jgi:hypothetical protein
MVQSDDISGANCSFDIKQKAEKLPIGVCSIIIFIVQASVISIILNFLEQETFKVLSTSNEVSVNT